MHSGHRGGLIHGDKQRSKLTMATLLQDSTFGHMVRILTKRRCFRYAEEKDPSLWRRHVNLEKSGRLAYHGRMDSVSIPEDHQLALSESVTRIPSTAWTHRGHNFQGLTGVRINPEQGKDVNVIDWWDENDPENPQNWALWKKIFVTFEICLLTFSVYIGSAIFTPGIPTVMEEFQIAQVPATLGLTIFVAGYGLGPLLWSPMSEVPQIGRNPVYIATLIVFVALQVPTALAKNLGTLLAFRFLTGFFGSPALATVRTLCSTNIIPADKSRAVLQSQICSGRPSAPMELESGVLAQSVDLCWDHWLEDLLPRLKAGPGRSGSLCG